MSEEKGGRNLSLDVLRIVATMAVIMLHVSSGGLDLQPLSADWHVSNVYRSIVCWCVPAFVMISGSLFLSQERSVNIRHLYGHNILRIVIAYFFWAIVYIPVQATDSITTSRFLAMLVIGPYHLWFLKMIVGLYIVVPILRRVTADRRTEEYFICLSLLTAFVIPFLLEIITMVDGGIGGVLSGAFDPFWLRLATGYTGYFVLGHYIVTYGLGRRTKVIVYALGTFGILLIIVGTSWLSLKNGANSLMLYNELTPLVLFQVTAIFVFFTSKEWTRLRRHQKSLTKLSNRTFAIYLIHVMVIELTENSFMMTYPVATIPAYVLANFALSYAVACVLAMIPGIKNYAI